ncbi:IS30 family transposase [Patescibacteria group bacterium]|nr:IS30 family transposase [Patescibacteria group bacterium]
MAFKHFSLEEREKLYAWKESGLSLRGIARKLGRDHSSVVREYKRNTRCAKPYVPCIAQKRADRVGSRQRYKAPLKGPETLLYVRQHLRMYWSPETISGRIGMDIPGASITPECIYQYVYKPQNRRYGLIKHLTLKRNHRKKVKCRAVRRVKIANAVSIDHRAKYIQKRVQIGHWETDNMEGPRSTRHVLSVTVERASRITLLNRLSSKKAKPRTNTLIRRMGKLPARIVKTITMDNGSENTLHEALSLRLGVNTYFCHPYHSWEKGTVENTIGRIRRYLPKGTDLKQVSQVKISELEYILNTTPRKCLGYLTPYEKMESELKKSRMTT